MMSILIRGMEMPKSCWDCFACHDGWCIINQKIEGHRTVTHSCPLIEVPNHGGLVDANRLIDIALHLMHTAKNDDIANGAKWLWQYILEAPIIIEAEEGE